MAQVRMKVLKEALTGAAIGGSFGVGKIFTCDTETAIALEKSGLARKAKDGEGEDDAPATPAASTDAPPAATPIAPK